ncbi:MAG TPA: 3-hydroxyacyl-CoA dehydrogenase, partial [Candidatus Saccharimonadia bacterium]|nr:3-hydroxyacyl-CoA dehydrogenase [Candidatus Saccharimonadia bacterium]
PFATIKAMFETVAMAKVSGSALEAKELGLLRATDPVVFNAHELLHVAISYARSLAESAYRPPLASRQIAVAGDAGIATLKMMLVNMLEGGFVSKHDFEVSSRIATVLCGGEVERGSLVDEQWLLDLERTHFVALAQMPKTQERIMHTLKTGKPLRN